MAYDNTNSGILTKNGRREKETHPEYAGSINVDGVEYWLSAWVKDGKDGSKLEGQKYFSLSVRPKEEKPRSQARHGDRPGGPNSAKKYQPKDTGTGFDDMDDDIPF